MRRLGLDEISARGDLRSRALLGLWLRCGNPLLRGHGILDLLIGRAITEKEVDIVLGLFFDALTGSQSNLER